MEDRWKLPPPEKIPEAYGAIVDDRVELGDGRAVVRSSDRTKQYLVTWRDGVYQSDDNASRWQGYPGYPILAVLMLRGELPLNREVAAFFRGVPWYELNRRFKRDYAAALASLLEVPPRPDTPPPAAVRAEIDRVFAALRQLPLPRRRPAAKTAAAPSGSAAEAPADASSRPAVPPVLCPVPRQLPSRETAPAAALAAARRAGRVVCEIDWAGGVAALLAGDEILLVAADGADAAEWTAFLRGLADPALLKTAHRVKELLAELNGRGIAGGGFVFDTALAAYLLDSTSGRYDLAELLGDALAAAAPAARVAAVEALEKVQREALERCGMTRLFDEAELPLCAVLAAMETAGFAVDRARLEAFGAQLTREAEAAQQQVFALAGARINLNSPKQLGELLFERLGLPAGRKTRSGYSTDIEVLESLREKHPAIAPLIEYRQLIKLKGTYADGLLTQIAADGRIHSRFQMTATATGRLSSIEPNLQNIPVRTARGSELRRMFVPRPGWRLVDADYSQIELRLLAHISGDETMRRAFREGGDIHAATAAQVFGVAPDAVTPEMRRRAKAVNFGIVYGISAFALAGDLGISRQEAERYRTRYFETYSGVRDYSREIVERARRDGFVATLLGRRRYLPELESPLRPVRAFGERVALNAPIQGSSADVIKLAMCRVHRELAAAGLRARLLLQIHDELIVETPPEEEEQVKKLLTSAMERVVELSVPLVAEAVGGDSWYGAKP